MRIALFACTRGHSFAGVALLWANVLVHLAALHPEPRFFIFSKDFSVAQPFPQNLEINTDIKTQRLFLKQNKPDVLLQCTCCAQAYKHGRNILYFTQRHGVLKKFGLFEKMRWRRRLQNAQHIFVSSSIEKNFFLQQFPEAQQKMIVQHPFLFEQNALPTAENIASWQAAHTSGAAYFLLPADGLNEAALTEVLKAFSLFKKRQKSSMRLVLAAQHGVLKKLAAGLLQHYKYRDDVVVLPLESLDATAFAAAYAAIVFTEHSFGDYFLNSAFFKTPMLLPQATALDEWSSGAAFIFDKENRQSLADALMLVYKDEKLRQQIVEKALANVEKAQWPQAAASLWHAISGNA